MDRELINLQNVSLTYQKLINHKLYEQFPSMKFNQAIHIMMDKQVIQSTYDFINSFKKLINY